MRQRQRAQQTRQAIDHIMFDEFEPARPKLVIDVLLAPVLLFFVGIDAHTVGDLSIAKFCSF
jgi:hypothetical protein